MAASVIKLEPMRMSEISATTSKYMPPNQRKASSVPEVTKIDLGVDSFPTLGSAPRKVAVWGANAGKVLALATALPLATPEPPADSLCNRIKDKINQEAAIAQRPRTTDIYQMTRQELEEDGWAVLNLSAAREIAMRFNDLPGYIQEPFEIY